MATLNDKNITDSSSLMTAIHTWLTSTLSNPWTDNGITVGTPVMGMSIGNLFVQFEWTTTNISISQSTATAGTAAFASETGESTLISLVDYPDGHVLANAELWGFANDTATPTERYAHFVLEYNKDGRFIHFGFGQIDTADKFFTWVGGAYKYGNTWDESSVGDEPWSATHKGPLLDSLHTSTVITNQSSMRVTDLRGMPVSTKWGMFSSGSPATIEGFTDDDGDNLSSLFGFVRYGPFGAAALWQPGSPNAASIPLVPVVVGFREASNAYMPLGRMPDVRICNIGQIQPKQQITFDSETWQFFPWGQKLTLGSPSPPVIATRNAGLAYRVS